MKKKTFSNFIRKVTRRAGKKEEAEPNSGSSAATTPPDQSSQQPNSGQVLATTPASGSMPDVAPMLPEIQQTSPMRLRSASSPNHGLQAAPRTYYILPVVPEEEEPKSTESSIHHNTTPPMKSMTDEPNSAESSIRRSPTPPMKPMMGDATFYRLPEYTGSSDSSYENDSQFNDMDRSEPEELTEKHGSDDTSPMSSSFSFSCRGLQPIDPPTPRDDGELAAEEAQSSPIHQDKTSTGEDVFVSSPYQVQDYRQTQSSPPRVPSPYRLAGPVRRYPFDNGTQSSPTSALRKVARNNKTQIPLNVVPVRGSSLRATHIKAIFEPSNLDPVSSRRPTPTVLRATAKQGPIDTLDYEDLTSSMHPSSARPQPLRVNCESFKPVAGLQQSGGTPLSQPVIKAPTPIKISLPASSLDRIFDPSAPREEPPIPRIFQRNTAPRVPDMFRDGLLENPPVSAPRSNGRFPRAEGVMNLRDEKNVARRMNELMEIEKSPQTEVIVKEQPEDPRFSNVSSLSTDRSSLGVDYQLGTGATAVQGRVSIQGKSKNLIGGSGVGSASDEGGNTDGEVEVNPYDRSGAQNRSGFYHNDD
jgi:hypothetical protein